MIIRFGYCPPNPGPKAKLNCRWYSNIDDAINSYDGNSSIWINATGIYRQITYTELLKYADR